MSALRYRQFWIRCGLGFALAIVIMSLIPDPPRPNRLMGVKLGHFFAYAWLMLWFAQIFKDTGKRLLVAAAICALGIALEYLQLLTGYRTFLYTDMRDNAFGVAVGFLASRTRLSGMLAAAEDALYRFIEKRFPIA